MEADGQRLAGRAGSAPPAIGVLATSRASRVPATLRAHWLIVALVAVGALLRTLAWVAYQPALLYGDSFRYLDNVGVHRPDGLHPIGYDLLVLRPVLTVGGLELVTALQHLVVLAAAVALYALGLRLGAPRWLAALGAAPLLLDAYQVQIEQMIMSDSWQQVLLVALLWVLLGRGAPGPRRAALAGLLLGVAVLFRLVAVSLVVPVLGYLLIAGGAWRCLRTWGGLRTVAARSLALLAMFAVVVGGYATYFQSATGQWGLTKSSGNVLYGRTAVLADCDRLELDPVVRLACPDEPLGARKGIDHYAHMVRFPEWVERFPPGTDIVAVQRSFGWAVLRAQPLDVAVAVGRDFVKGFRPIRVDAPGDVRAERWYFTAGYQYYGHREVSTEYSVEFSGREPSSVPELGRLLRGYQLGGGYVSGSVLGVLGIIGLLAGFGLGRARASGIRSACLLATGMGLTILLASAVFEFSWRYQLPGLVLLSFAGVLGITALRGPPRRPG